MENSLSVLVETQLTLYVSYILATISRLNLIDFDEYCAPSDPPIFREWCRAVLSLFVCLFVCFLGVTTLLVVFSTAP